ncbi:hypothetical protein E0L93_06035 [Rubrobacter taiwanensis]|uniref:Uncharacterized protein n=1 Tax=Rubrobacter taiwanensis TaxID=185139 RepID=A0A4R1BLU0_9ACTN|nr:hypothetical protein [Rubrobacter taiwanensis]TCJ18297.1 hypothetical protein E0L93_06035 [Rubrobacter taiwanensis]
MLRWGRHLVFSMEHPFLKFAERGEGSYFKVERVLEPRPTGQFEATDPEEYRRLLREPGFLCVRAAKREVGR